MAQAGALTKASPHRRSMIAKIHVAKTQINLEEDDYRQMLFDVAGKSSSAECSERELEAVIERLKSLGFTPIPARGGKKQNELSKDHLNKIVDTWRAREDVERYATVVTREQIAENGYNLNIPRYVDTFEPEEEIDIAAVQAEIEELEKELAETRQKMNGYLKELGVL